MSGIGFEGACRLRQAFFVAVTIFVAACSGGSPFDSRRDIADGVARSADMTPVRIRSGTFEIQGFRGTTVSVGGKNEIS